MKIGIVRHFKVNCPAPKYMNSDDFIEYQRKYDIESVIENEVELDENMWPVCFCSTLPRAVTTAERIYHGNMIKTDLLREVPMSPPRRLNHRIPGFIWSADARFAWFRNHKSQKEGAVQTKKRVNKFLEMIDFDSDQNVLIVSHGFVCFTLVRTLKKRGFKGEIPVHIRNGQLYILDNSNALKSAKINKIKKAK